MQDHWVNLYMKQFGYQTEKKKASMWAGGWQRQSVLRDLARHTLQEELHKNSVWLTITWWHRSTLMSNCWLAGFCISCWGRGEHSKGRRNRIHSFYLWEGMWRHTRCLVLEEARWVDGHGTLWSNTQVCIYTQVMFFCHIQYTSKVFHAMRRDRK